MSDIFISYKREDQATARKLADALEKEGWSVWWDPKLRAGEHFDDVIEKALTSVKCVVVLWSKGSVKSQYVRDEATYALEHNKLVPVAIEAVEMPFRFRGVQTLRLLAWDGARDSFDFHKLVDDISAILVNSSAILDHAKQTAEEERFREQERQQEYERRQTEEANRRRIEQEVSSPWRRYGLAAAALALVIFSFVFWWPKRQETVVPAWEKVFRDRLKSGGEGPVMVVVPAGSFQMGDVQGGGYKDEVPVRIVRIEKPFAIGRYEVTFDEYDQFAGATGRELPGDEGWGRGLRPVVNVLWRDGVEYAKWLSAQTGKRYRLPTEAEWEYAARGGMETAYWWGKHLLKGMANCDGCGSQWDGIKTAPVGSFNPNPFGLYDTAGNVRELVEDCWHDNYSSAPPDSSAWKETGSGDCSKHVFRGGSWTDRPQLLRSSERGGLSAAGENNLYGFRVAQDIN